MATAGGEREQFREGKIGKEEKTHKMSLLPDDAVESGSLLTDDYDARRIRSFLSDDYDDVHIIVMGDSEEAIKQLICLFTQTSLHTQEEPVVAVDTKRVLYEWKTVVQQWQVRRERRSFFLYQLPAGCDPHTFGIFSFAHYKRTLPKYRFLPIVWWVVCESLHHALPYMVKRKYSPLFDFNLPIVLLNCIMSIEKKCQHIKVVGCIRLGDLAIPDIRACFGEIQNVALIHKLSEKDLFKVFEHESMSSEKWDVDKGGQLFTIAMQAQGLSQLLQQSKNLMIEDGLNCAWGSWCLPSIYRMLHLSAELIHDLTFSILELHLIWHFPFNNDMEFDDEQFLDDDRKYRNNIVIRAGYFVGLIIWMKWSHITKSLEAYINTNVQRPWMETSRSFRRSSFGTKVNEFFQGLKPLQKSVTSDEIEKFYHSLLLDGDLDCNNDEKIFQHISPHDDLHKELENIFKDMAVISVNQVVCRANADTVIARKNSTRRDDLELVFHTGKAMSSCVGVGLDHSIVELGKEVLVKQKKQSLWEETLGQVANREEGYVIVQVRNNFACSCIRTFTQETNTSENPYGVSLGAVTSYYEMQSTPNCPHGHAPLLHLLSKFVLAVLKEKQSLHKVSKYGEKPLMLFDFERLREAVRVVGGELDAGHVAQSTAKDLISGVVVVSGDAGGSSVNSEFGGVGTSEGTSSNDGNADQDGTDSSNQDDGDKKGGCDGSQSNGSNDGDDRGDDGDDNGDPNNEGCLEDANDRERNYKQVILELDADGIFESPPPLNIGNETIAPRIIFDFQLESKSRSITMTASTKFSQSAEAEAGHRFVWYHDDLELAIAAHNKEARLEGLGEILNPKATQSELYVTNNGSKAQALTRSGEIDGEVELAIAKAKVKGSVSSNSQKSASQGYNMQLPGADHVCGGFSARPQSSSYALRFILQFPLRFYKSLPLPDVNEQLVHESGLFRSIEPEIKGKWIPLNALENSPYFFEARRAWKNLDDESSKYKQYYKIPLYVNHAMSHLRAPDDDSWVRKGLPCP